MSHHPEPPGLLDFYFLQCDGWTFELVRNLIQYTSDKAWAFCTSYKFIANITGPWTTLLRSEIPLETVLFALGKVNS